VIWFVIWFVIRFVIWFVIWFVVMLFVATAISSFITGYRVNIFDAKTGSEQSYGKKETYKQYGYGHKYPRQNGKSSVT